VTTTALPRSERGDVRIAAIVLAVAATAWVLTGDRMAGMDAGPATELGGLGWFAVSWLMMMAAMMLPAVAPMAVAYGRHAGRAVPTVLFVAGYLLTWLAAGLVAYAAIQAVRALGLGILAWDQGGRYLAAGVIAGAGLYQLTPSKQACLRRCRDRSAFLGGDWRPTPGAAVRMGLGHGGFCVGCTWALMAALFALGVMSLTWMAVVAVLVVAERILPRPAPLAVTLVLVALGTAVALAPGDVPGFTVPESESTPGMRMDWTSPAATANWATPRTVCFATLAVLRSGAATDRASGPLKLQQIRQL
jgi:predicted metal-binding membrane protein